MTRACFALTLLLVALGGSLSVTSPARCQTTADYHRYGSCYHEACPIVDGYIQTDEEVTEPTEQSQPTNAADLRGRMVVAFLDDPVAFEASEVDEAVADEQSDAASASGLADIRSSSSTVESVNDSDVAEDVYNYNDRYEYMSKHGYYGQRYPEYYNSAAAAAPEAATAALPVIAPPLESPVAASADPCVKPYAVYDHVHHYDRAFDVQGPAGAQLAAADTAVDAEQPTTEVVQDCENEVYQAYLQRCAEEAVARVLMANLGEPADESDPPYDPYGYEYRYVANQAATESVPSGVAVADQAVSESALIDDYAPYEPYNAEPEPAYEVYEYDEYDYGYCPAMTEQSPAVQTPIAPAEPPCDPSSYAKYPYRYGYGYGYDYGYDHEYDHHQGYTPPAATTQPSQEPEADTQPAIDVLDVIEMGRDGLDAVLQSGAVELIRTHVQQVSAKLVALVRAIDMERVRDSAVETMAAALRQPVSTPDDWSESDVFVFMFESDLNADPVAPSDLEQTPWIVENETVVSQEPVEQESAAVAAPVDDSVSAVVPFDRQLVLQWTRRAIDVAGAAWNRLTIVLHRVADSSLANLPSDHPADSTQR